jgi:DNA-binding transcriptional regulator YhcF (GntR family)
MSQESAPHKSDPANSYAILRISTAFLLESAERARGFVGGDLLRNLIFLAIWQECLGDVPLAATHNELERGDFAQRVVTVREVADRMKVPYETVRRHANELVQEGICVRAKGHGIMIAASRMRAMAKPDLLRDEAEHVKALASALSLAGLAT